MNEHPVSGKVEVKAGLSVRASVQYTGGWTWESRWLLVTKYLARLQEIYSGAQIESNTGNVPGRLQWCAWPTGREGTQSS